MARMNSSNGKKQRFGWQRADADGREDTQKQRNGSKKLPLPNYREYGNKYNIFLKTKWEIKKK